MSNNSRVIAYLVLSAAIALGLLGALSWRSAGPVDPEQARLQQQEMEKIVAGSKPKPTPKPTPWPTPDPAWPETTIRVYKPSGLGNNLWMCTVQFFNKAGGKLNGGPVPMCSVQADGHGTASAKFPPGLVDSVQAWGVEAFGKFRCQSDRTYLQGAYFKFLRCLPM